MWENQAENSVTELKSIQIRETTMKKQLVPKRPPKGHQKAYLKTQVLESVIPNKKLYRLERESFWIKINAITPWDSMLIANSIACCVCNYIYLLLYLHFLHVTLCLTILMHVYFTVLGYIR